MDQYYRITNQGNLNKINYYNPLCGCFQDMCSCSMGFFFPFCLFGRIYEKAGFGSCWVGCCKFFSLQFLISTFFSLIMFFTEWNMLISKNPSVMNDINKCIKNTTCENEYKNFKFNTTKCLINNTTITCDCLREPLQKQCDFNNNLPDLINDMSIVIFFINILSILTICTVFGLCLGHYRNKISHKYNILYNSRYNFLIHFLPCTNQCALCQEYNTINIIETVIQSSPPIAVATEVKLN